MKSRYLLLITVGMLAAPVAAQIRQGVRVERSGSVGAVAAAPGVPLWVGGANTFEFVAAGPAFGGEVVTGAPYSAEAVTETQQTLADGNKISRTSRSRIYRDSQGRTRREQTIGALGPWASQGEPIEMVMINDPVAGVNYALNTRERTAMKTEVHHLEMAKLPNKIEAAKAEGDVLHWKAEMPEGRAGMIFRRERHEVKQGEEGEQHDVTVMHPGAAGFAFAKAEFSNDNVKTESLGRQMIEGVEADGTRTTITIPAGQIGNERPIETVSESWYSQQLKTLVLSKQSDPRMGETTYRLSDIQLVEPLPSLFEPPADYTIQEGPQMKYFERHITTDESAEPGR